MREGGENRWRAGARRVYIRRKASLRSHKDFWKYDRKLDKKRNETETIAPMERGAPKVLSSGLVKLWTCFP